MDIKKFIEQDEELEAFITGPAGSGKTTNLADTIIEVNKLKIPYQVVAYTHKAKEVLLSKLPPGTPISTLHSWLKKRPGVNEKATHIRALLTSKQFGKPEPLRLLIVDEFSFVGEKDYYSIGELQDDFQLESNLEVTTETCTSCNWSRKTTNDLITLDKCPECGCKDIEVVTEVPSNVKVPKPLKVLYIGDLNQLSPIDGPSAVRPGGAFWSKLETIHRQTVDGLSQPLSRLVNMLEGTEPVAYLEPTEYFRRGVNIDEEFKLSLKRVGECSRIMLAWTNKAVQEHNTKIQGYNFPKSGDLVYNSSLREEFGWECTRNLEDSMVLITPTGVIDKDTKYNPFKELRNNKDIIYVQTDNGSIIPCIFGTYNNKSIRAKLGLALTKANKGNKSETIRKNAYKAYKVVNDYVSVVDFPYCQTIHKSQGQEFDEVFIDSIDLAKNRDIKERLKLLYVAMSRAKYKLYLNN